MINPFSFRGAIGRVTYILWSIPLFLSQHAFAWFGARLQGFAIKTDETFFFLPLRALMARGQSFDQPPVQLTTPFLTLILIYLLIVSWALAALSYRRAVDAGGGAWLAALAFVPLLQIPAIGFLCCASTRETDTDDQVLVHDRERRMAGWKGGLQGLLAGIALTLAAVATSALIFGTYGYGIFVVSPFVIGAVTAYFANRHTEISIGETARIVAATTILGSLALIVLALEGIGCLIMAAPLGILAALMGGFIGRQIALGFKNAGNQIASSVAMLPLIFAIEAVFPPLATFDTLQTIKVSAPPDKVWEAIVRMETIAEPVSLPFRMGVAYPIRGRVFGEGVGALRYGEFSTGTAVERVTEWERNRKLAFVVLNDIPGLRELSPYRHVHAPHVHGYFRTRTTSFELAEHGNGITEIIERTSHELRLDPAMYWLPFARWMVDQNNARVLAHIKRQAEKSAVAAVNQVTDRVRK